MSEPAGGETPQAASGPSARSYAGALLGGRYRLGALLGVGGSAAVYEAEDLRVPGTDGTSATVAVKVLHATLCATAAGREAFLREAERARLLRHPNIIGVRDSGLHDAGGVVQAWIALDVADGRTLEELVRTGGPLPLRDAGAVMDGVLAGLAAAHDAGLVHRDISPRNVMLVEDRPSAGGLSPSAVRILDFGLADVEGRTTLGANLLLAPDRDSEGEASGSSQAVVGNASFVSPEQAQGQPVTTAGDIYQAGGVLYFLLTGQPPFPRTTTAQMVEAHLSAPPPVPSALVPSAAPMDRIVATALTKDPSRRFENAERFRMAIADAVTPGRGLGSGEERAAACTDAYPRTRVIRAPGAAWSPSVRDRVEALPRSRRDDAMGYLSASVAGDFPPLGPGPGSRGRGVPAGVVVAGVAIAVVAVISVLSPFAGAATRPRPLGSETPLRPSSASATASATETPTAARRVAVPSLHGTLDAAERRLRAAGLVLGEISATVSAEPAGTVLGQSPEPGLRLVPGAAVNVEVASGSNEVPRVAGMTVGAAVAALQSAGFTITTGQVTVSATTPVLRTEPDGGTVLRLGVPISLILDNDTATPPAGAPTSGPPTPPASP
ncbi:Serine/threonine-protein kinase PknB [Propionicimonas sp. T2.31MG-18]